MGILYICLSGVGSIRCFIDMAVQSRPPPPHGREPDGKGDLWCVLIHTGEEHGDVIGKCTMEECWYGWRGVEYYLRGAFGWIPNFCVLREEPFQQNVAQQWGYSPNGGYERLWFAVVDTDHGLIPCKASSQKCWYTYGGLEYEKSYGFRYLWPFPADVGGSAGGSVGEVISSVGSPCEKTSTGI